MTYSLHQRKFFCTFVRKEATRATETHNIHLMNHTEENIQEWKESLTRGKRRQILMSWLSFYKQNKSIHFDRIDTLNQQLDAVTAEEYIVYNKNYKVFSDDV